MSTIPKIPPEKMSSEEKYDYIFSEKRFEWIDHALIGDIQTFEDGIKHNYFPPRQFLPTDFPRGGGNLALPILVCTSLDLISALYTGCNNATENVKKFIGEYSPGFYKEFPLIFWNGVRNGITVIGGIKFPNSVGTFSPVQIKLSIKCSNPLSVVRFVECSPHRASFDLSSDNFHPGYSS